MTISASQIRAAIDRGRQKLTRQQHAVDATVAELAMFEQQLEQIEATASGKGPKK